MSPCEDVALAVGELVQGVGVELLAGVEVVQLALVVAQLPGHVGWDAALPVRSELLEQLEHRPVRQPAVSYDLHRRSALVHMRRALVHMRSALVHRRDVLE